MKKNSGALVAAVHPGSLAEQAGLRAGDRITAIDGRPVEDVVDWRFRTAADSFTLDVVRADGAQVQIPVEKTFDAAGDLGLEFEDVLFDGIHLCHNKCVFCFLAQQPKGMRRSLYIKDDDYRLSFMHGNFITLTDLPEADFERIIEQRLSPLYISVHATEEDVREVLFGTKRAGDVLPKLRRFLAAGIRIHAQMVLCPGLNDGVHLDRSIADLRELGDGILTISAVPVGLTKYRETLHPLQVYTKENARQVMRQLDAWQQVFLRERGSRVVFASDEFYVLAELPVPEADFYEGYPQLGNGVGMIRKFTDEFAAVAPRLPAALPRPRRVLVVTSHCGAPILRDMAERLNRVQGLHVEVLRVENEFFGPTVTVAGLLTAEDIARAVGQRPEVDAVLIPEVAMRDGDGKFLDDWTVQDIARRVWTQVQVVPVDGRALAEAALGPGAQLLPARRLRVKAGRLRRPKGAVSQA